MGMLIDLLVMALVIIAALLVDSYVGIHGYLAKKA
jgi:hypothetical protein